MDWICVNDMRPPKDGTVIDIWTEAAEPERGRLYRGRRIASVVWVERLEFWSKEEDDNPHRDALGEGRIIKFWSTVNAPQSRERQRRLERRYFAMCAKITVRNMFMLPRLTRKPNTATAIGDGQGSK